MTSSSLSFFVASPQVIKVSVAAKSLTFEDFYKAYPTHDTYPPATVFAKGTVNFKAELGGWGRPVDATLVSGRVYSIPTTTAIKTLAVGDVLVAATRYGYTVTSSHTTNITFEDVRIYAASNMAITEFQGGGGNTYRNVSLVPRGPATPLGSN